MQWNHGIRTRLAATQLRAIGRVGRGSRLLGIHNANRYGELAWNSAMRDAGVAAEIVASRKIVVDDANTY